MNTRALVLFFLARKNCAILKEICEALNLSENNAKVALSRLAKEKFITRRWLKDIEGKKI